jgi:hypothetical protein
MAAATFQTDLTEIITQAVEAAAMVGSLWSSAKMVEQSRAYYNLYHTQRQFYYNVFQTGAEAPLAATVYSANVAVINYTSANAELYLATGIFGGPMGDTLGWWARHSTMFGATPSTTILSEEYAQDRILFQGHWANVMFRFEESNVDLLNDQRWDHRMKLHNVAMKQQSAVVSELASGVGLREEAMTKTSSYLGDAANSLAERRGLIQGHKDAQARYAEIANSSSSVYRASPRSAATYRGPSANSGAQTFAYGSNPSGNDHFRNAQ